MILEKINMASTVLDGEEEKPQEETTPSEESPASATLLDGDGDGDADKPSEEGSDGDKPSESPKEGEEATN